jgi:EmrB/QacA subfamily drug resistance transporter
MPSHILTPLIVACALFMENLDSTVIATSLPAIAQDMHEDPIALKLALTSYLLSLAVFIPVSGWAADRYGAKQVFRAAIVIFMLGSIACGFAVSLPDFVLFRIVQGMGGAMMVPVGRLVVLRSVPKDEFVSALSWFTIPALIGPIFGPPVGGFITTYAHWRWIFFINVPVGLIGIVLVTRFIGDLREENPPPLDRLGLLLLGIGLSGIVFGLAVLGQNLVPIWLSGGITLIGLVFCLIYALHARRTAHPVLNLRLLNSPTFRASVIGGSIFRIGVGATPFLLPLMFQIGFGLSAFASGLLTFASAAGAMTMKFTAQPILRRFGFRPVLIVNAVISAAFIGIYGLFTPSTPHAVIIGLLLTGGFFRSLEFTSINAIAYADVDAARMSQATSFVSAAQQVSLSIGVALAALMLEAVRAGRGDGVITRADFAPAFMLVALTSACSALMFARLPRDAGAALSGRAMAEAVAVAETEGGPAAPAVAPAGQAVRT